MSDLYINSCSTESSCNIEVDTGRWDSDGQLHTLEFLADKSQRDQLWSSIIPGKVSEWDFTFSKTYYRDTTYYSGNTLKLTPKDGTNITDIRDEMKIVVKDYKEELAGRPADKYFITISGYEYKPF